MKRVATVVAKNNGFILLSLIKAPRCEGCPSYCNKPLVNLFGLNDNLLRISADEHQYQLNDPNGLVVNSQASLGQPVQLEFESKDIFSSSLRLYLIPLILMVLFLTAGHFLAKLLGIHPDLLAIVGFFSGLVIAAFVLNQKNNKFNLKFMPEVTIS